MRKSIKKILMDRDGLSSQEAQKMINQARNELMTLIEEGRFVETDDFCYEWFGLEPDYLSELIPI